jgi:NADH-quinone oxidoreductase subunit F
MGVPVYRRILDLFEAEGVNTVFGIPDPNFVHMFLEADRRGWAVVAPHHEESAGFMAEAAARMTGKPGLCIGTLGPGVANLAGAMMCAKVENSPVIFIGGQRARITERRVRRGRIQFVRQEALVEPSVKYSASIEYADQTDEIVHEALRRAIELGPAGVIAELKDAKLLGRGGAAFPTGAKWEAVARNPLRPHYFVANADESEPGTFKDRVLLDHDPYALVEALTVAGITTGAEQGFVYLRGEYPLAASRVEHAAAQARRRGFLGADVMGSGLAFDLEVRRGAGAYIAGEETALFNSIEGRRPEPRNKPPFPVDRGLFDRPTGVNNVETLLAVLEVLRIGGLAYAATGTPGSTGTRLFCLSGRVARPGLYEVPMGTSLGALLSLAGGVAGGRPLQAVLLGGAAGTFVGPEDLDLPLSFEGAREAGATLGSGVVVVLDDTVDVSGFLVRVTQFFRDESCGQCVPCRVGTQRQEEIIGRLTAGRPLESVDAELALLTDLDAVMRDASICGLGQTATSAVRSALRQGLVAGVSDAGARARGPGTAGGSAGESEGGA